LRFALITDVHFGPSAFFEGKLRKLSHEAARLTGEFVERMNAVERPDLVVNLGDVIQDESPERDRENYARFLSIMDGLEAPLMHVAGNHDSVHLGDAELAALWRHEGPLYYSRDHAGVHFAVLQTREAHGVAVHLSDTQLEWLKSDLELTRLPAIVLMHHPASEQRLEHNRWFEHAPHICRVAERRALRRVLEASGIVVAVFNGHVHWNHLDVIGGIPYLTLQSLIENLDEDAPGRAARAWAVCELDAHRLSVDVQGAEPARYQFEFALSERV
jgi:3',5'-cyclic-AMP phosphodiesterase